MAEPSTPFSHQQTKINRSTPAEFQRQDQGILPNLEIAKLMEKKLGSRAHTSDQLREVIETILSTIYKMEKGENAEEKQIIPDFFETVSEMEQKGELFYHFVG